MGKWLKPKYHVKIDNQCVKTLDIGRNVQDYNDSSNLKTDTYFHEAIIIVLYMNNKSINSIDTMLLFKRLHQEFLWTTIYPSSGCA